MSLRIRRGSDTSRQSTALDTGELVWTTDTNKLFVGGVVNNSNLGGINILASSAGTGLTWNATTQCIDFGGLGSYSTDNLPEGTSPSKRYFTTARAKDAAASIFTATGTPTTTGTIVGTNVNGTVTLGASVSTGVLNQGQAFVVTGSGLPINGLTATTYYIVSASGTSVVLASSLANAMAGTAITSITNTGSGISNVNYSAGTADSGITFSYDSVNKVMNVTSSGVTTLLNDLTPTLGGNLILNARSITGTGNISISGNISATNIGNSQLTITNNTINTSTTSLIFANSNLSVITLQGLTDGNSSGVSGIEMRASRGTIASPLTTQANDIIGRITLSGWNGTENKSASTLYASWAANAVLTDVSPASNLFFYVGGGGSTTKTAIFTSGGVFSAPILKTGSYDGSANYPAIPVNPSTAAGVIIYDSITNHWSGWNGTTWKQIDSNGTTSSYAQTIASASTIAPTQRITFVSGTTQILTITPPADMAIGASATFNATISGTTLTVTSVPTGTITVGSLISGSGVSTGTVIISNISGSGNGSTWTVSIGQILTPATAINAVGNSGGQLTLIPTGAWSTGTSGNIALASTAVPSKALIMTYDHNTTKWYPSY
jgi:hypothetical protein